MGARFKREELFKQIAYPARYKNRNLGKTACIQFFVLFIFLLLYKPFGVYEPEMRFNYILICSFHARSPAFIVYAYFYLLNYYRTKNGRHLEWTLFREYSHICIILFLIGLASFSMRSLIYNNQDNRSWRYFWEEIRNCYLVGTLFYFYLLQANFYFQSKIMPAHSVRSDLVARQYKSPESHDRELFIHTKVKQDDFSFNPDHLLFV
jgi:hypothetical protein